MFAFSHDLFVHADGYREVFQAMSGTHSGIVVQRLIHKLLVDLVRDDVKAATEGQAGCVVTAEAVAQFVAGGLFGLLTWWLGARTPLPAAEVNELFQRMALPALRVS